MKAEAYVPVYILSSACMPMLKKRSDANAITCMLFVIASCELLLVDHAPTLEV